MKAIYKQHRKRRGRSKYLLSVEASVVKGEESLPVRFVFVRNRNHRKDWLVLVTTDMSLTAEEVICIYGKRWGIEVFFKVCKSFLRLEKDCLSLSYNVMTAHVSIVFTRYMFLAVEQRECKDARSLGELFYLSADKMKSPRFAQMRCIYSGQRQPIMRRASRLHSWDVFAYEPLPNRLRPSDLALGRLSKETNRRRSGATSRICRRREDSADA